MGKVILRLMHQNIPYLPPHTHTRAHTRTHARTDAQFRCQFRHTVQITYIKVSRMRYTVSEHYAKQCKTHTDKACYQCSNGDSRRETTAFQTRAQIHHKFHEHTVTLTYLLTHLLHDAESFLRS